MSVRKVNRIELPQHGDDSRGQLVIAEAGTTIPFAIKRVFYIYGVDRQTIRGAHANRNTEFVLICIVGKCKIRVKDGRENEVVYCLERPNEGIYLPKMVWKDMYDFSEDAVLLVLASEHYDIVEYIRDYDAYVKECSMT